MIAKQWLTNARGIMDKIEQTQIENIKKAAGVMADSIAAGRWVHTFGCGHAKGLMPRLQNTSAG